MCNSNWSHVLSPQTSHGKSSLLWHYCHIQPNVNKPQSLTVDNNVLSVWEQSTLIVDVSVTNMTLTVQVSIHPSDPRKLSWKPHCMYAGTNVTNMPGVYMYVNVYVFVCIHACVVSECIGISRNEIPYLCRFLTFFLLLSRSNTTTTATILVTTEQNMRKKFNPKCVSTAANGFQW